MVGEPATGALPRISDYVAHWASRTPDAEAVVFADERVTYAELNRRVDAFANGLLQAGVGKGDRVAMLSTPRTEFWVSFLGTVSIGAVWVGLNPRHTRDELDYVVRDSGPRVLVSLTEFEGRAFAPDMAALRSAHDHIQHVVAFGGEISDAVDWDAFQGPATETPDLQQSRAQVQTMDPALIVYTSGTTGRPKGAMLSHRGLSYGANIQTDHFQVSTPSLVCCFPVDHVASVADTCATTLVKGGKIVFQERFDPGVWLDALESERCTIWGGIPTMLQMQLADPALNERDLSSIEVVIWGGAAMPRDGIKALGDFAPRLITAYGLTETSAHVTYSDPDADLEALAESVGRPDPRCPCRIVAEDGAVCSVGEPGELQFFGDYLMLGYWNRPEATAAAFTEDGWLKTGDRGYWREDGNITLVGRLSEMFKSGGYNVYPREIEIALEAMPQVAMAAVVPAPDPLFQEVGHAYVLLEPGRTVTPDELQAHCAERLANYKIPKAFFPRRDLPMLPVGKIDKSALKAMAAKEVS